MADFLASGLDPKKSTLFLQSLVTTHAELYLLLGMNTPLSWLERCPTYKDMMANMGEKDIATHGFLGYPVLQAADILMYKADLVPVGEDQIPHLEMSREIARRHFPETKFSPSLTLLTKSVLPESMAAR